MRIELQAPRLSQSRAGHAVLLMDEMLGHCRQWMNGMAALQYLDIRQIGVDDLYRYVAVLLLSHLTGLSFENTTYLLSDLNKALHLIRVRYICTHMLAYTATNQRDMQESSWSAQRDETLYLDTFE